MKKQIKEIILGSGLGELKFGMTREEVKKLVGKPDEVENLPGFDEEVNDELESWHYEESEFSLVFDADYDWKLVSIAISDPFFTLNGHSVIGMERDEVMSLFDKMGIEISNEEDLSDDENPDLELVESEELGLMVWFSDGEAIEMQILPDVEEDGETIKWP
ncbi:MAG: hypothetical protein IPO92_11040 [Saprospiraceae bacterium]|nr:hypothetical protein [Saprospiraceae bacterium]